jgi:hypothetical protein
MSRGRRASGWRRALAIARGRCAGSGRSAGTTGTCCGTRRRVRRPRGRSPRPRAVCLDHRYPRTESYRAARRPHSDASRPPAPEHPQGPAGSTVEARRERPHHEVLPGVWRKRWLHPRGTMMLKPSAAAATARPPSTTTKSRPRVRPSTSAELERVGVTLPSTEPRPFDSRVEEGFARDFARDWSAGRPPMPSADPGQAWASRSAL